MCERYCLGMCLGYATCTPCGTLYAVRFLHLWAARFSRHSVSRHRIENDVFGNTLGTG